MDSSRNPQSSAATSAPDSAAASTPRFTLIDTPGELVKAVNALRRQAAEGVRPGQLIVDCEGNKLGNVGGKLSLLIIGIRTPPSAQSFHVYIIDVCALTPNQLRPVFNILEGRTPKYMYDGRKDYSALYHEFGVSMEEVRDLTLADVASRMGGVEGEKDRLRRLTFFIPPYIMNNNTSLYDGIHKLNSANQSIEEHNIKTSVKEKGEYLISEESTKR